MAENRGIVFLVGAGPGDPGLLTRRGEQLLKEAEVVVYDHLANPRLLDLVPTEAIRVSAGKSVGHCTMTQDLINAALVDHARAGRRVVRLKGGDPYIFGRGSEEEEYLRAASIPCQVIPGVTAAVGVSAYAGISLTHRESASAVAFVTGHGHADPNRSGGGKDLDWNALAAFPGTLVIYMGVTRLESLCQTLIERGKDRRTPAAMIGSGTLARQRTVEGTLETLPERVKTDGLRPPGLLVIGKVVNRRPVRSWFEELPLFGQRIVVTRPRDEAVRAASSLEALGAEALIAPTVEILPLESYAQLDQTIDHLSRYHWAVFTSSNGVQAFFDRLEAVGHDLRAVGHLKLAAIGPATADALRRYHLRADLIPRSFRSEDLAEALVKEVKGQRVLLLRADRGRTILQEELGQVAQVDQVALYRNADVASIPEEIVRRVEEGSIDWITLTSSAITNRLHSLLGEQGRSRIGREIKLASLSPVTSATATQLGWKVAAEAKEYTWAGLVEALVEASQPSIAEEQPA